MFVESRVEVAEGKNLLILLGLPIPPTYLEGILILGEFRGVWCSGYNGDL